MNKTLLFFFALLSCSMSVLHARVTDRKQAPNHNMVFIENKGQIRDQYNGLRRDIDFALQDRGMSLFIGPGRIHYQFRKNNDPVRPVIMEGSQQTQPPKQVTYTVYRLDMELVGADFNVAPQMEEKQAASQHFYISQEAIRDVGSYNKLTYKQVYPGIDWVIYLRNGQLKYDFMLQPGADLSLIRIKYNGASETSLSEDGSLHIRTPLGILTEDAPVAWTAKDKKNVACNFVQKNGEWGFATAPYTGGLVLDPGLGWGTYFGGDGIEGANPTISLCAEKEAPYNLYITAETESINRIATTGAHQTILSGSTDAFLAKMTPEGKLIWSTYFGGANEDIATSVSADKFGNVYIAGSTLSSGLATAGSHNTVKAGIAYNNYLARFDSAGRLKWATYYGQAGGDNEKAYVAACSDGTVYFCSSTMESSGISTPGAFKEQVNDTWGVYSAYVVKFDSTGKRIWGTYYGGAGTPGPTGQDGYTLTEGGIAVDGQDNVFIFGSATDHTHFDFTGAHQPLHAGGSYDCFLGKLDKEGKHQWGTYFGTSGEDRARAICTDHEGNVFVALQTLGTDNLATPGTSRSTTLGNGEFMGDFALSKFNGSGKQEWGTYVGPEKGIAMMGGLAADACNNVYVNGPTIGYTDIQPTPDAYQSDFKTAPGFFAFNSYLFRYGSMDGQLQYSSFYGTPSTSAFALCSDPLGTLYMAGMAVTDSGIATDGAHQGQQYGEADLFITQFLGINIDPMFEDTLICVNGTFELPFITPGIFQKDNEFSVEISDLAGDFSYTTPVIIGKTTALGSGSLTCTLPASALAGEVYRIRMRASAPEALGSCWRTITVRQNGTPAEITVDKFVLGTVLSYESYQWYWNGAAIQGATNPKYTVTENGDYSVVVTEANGCVDSSNIYTVNNVGMGNLPAGTDACSVYPNPFNEVVYIKSRVATYVTLSDITGKVLLHQENSGSLSLKAHAPGIYFIQLSDRDGNTLLRKKLVRTGNN